MPRNSRLNSKGIDFFLLLLLLFLFRLPVFTFLLFAYHIIICMILWSSVTEVSYLLLHHKILRYTHAVDVYISTVPQNRGGLYLPNISDTLSRPDLFILLSFCTYIIIYVTIIIPRAFVVYTYINASSELQSLTAGAKT